MLGNLKELVKYRGLITALVARHLAARYRGSFLGYLWSLLNPLCLMLVYMLVFKYYIRFNSVENYSVFLFVGLLPWIWLSNSLTEGANAIVANGSLVTKSMFPPQALPIVTVLTEMVHFFLSLPVLFLIILFQGEKIPASVAYLPFLIAMQLFLLYGLTLSVSVLNVFYRDVQHLTANFLTLLFFLCPVIYPVKVVPESLRFTLTLNPFALLIHFYHQLLLEGKPPELPSLFYFLVFSFIVVWLSSMIFGKYREKIAEML